MKSERGISIIIPFLNEEEGISLCCNELDDYAKDKAFPIEIVFVDDGSTDKTVEKLKEQQFNNIKEVKLVSLSKNCGSHAAIRAGLTRAKYDVCTWIGSDLQDPLEIIEKGYYLITEEGYDAVYVEKKSIKVGKSTRLFSKIYSHLVRKYAVKNYSSDGVSTIIFDKKIKDYVNSNIESNSSIMLQIMDTGFKVTNLPVEYKERATGKSKWTFSKKVKLMIDSFVSFSFMPIRLVSIVGIVLFFLGIAIGIYAVINKIMSPNVPMGYSTLLSVMALGFGITNISLGVIAEYVWRAYDSARRRPEFIVAKELQLK